MINGNAPAIDAEGVVGLATVPQLYLRLAPVVAKELLLLLSGYVEQIEKDVGVLTSPFISQKAE